MAAMVNNRHINFGSGGTYNESVHVQGDLIHGNKIVGQDLNSAIAEIQKLLHQLQSQCPSEEATQKVANELADQAKADPERKQTLMQLGRYVAANGGIEAGIGKAIELALKLLIGV